MRVLPWPKKQCACGNEICACGQNKPLLKKGDLPRTKTELLCECCDSCKNVKGKRKIDTTHDKPHVVLEGEQKVCLRVKGMTCASCVATIENYVGGQEGIKDITIALLTEKAEVTYDAGETTQEAVREAISGLGFEAEIIEVSVGEGKVTLIVEGMTCSSCSGSIENVLQGTPGILSATVSHVTNQAKVTPLLRCVSSFVT